MDEKITLDSVAAAEVKEKPAKKKTEIFNENVRLDYFRKPDNAKSKSLKFLLNLLVIVFFVMYGLILAFAIETKNNDGIPTFAGTGYYEFSNIPTELNTNKKMASFDLDATYSVGDVVGYKVFNYDTGKMEVLVGKVQKQDAKTVTFTSGENVEKSKIFGVYKTSEDTSFLYSMMTNKFTYIYWCLFPIIVFFIISISCYFILYPRKVRLAFFEEMFRSDNDKGMKSSLEINAPSHPAQIQVVEQDENLAEYSPEDDEDKIAGTEFETFYTSTRSKNGELYARVQKYPDAVNSLRETGASDMDIIRMNMVGNNEFNALLTSTHREKPMTLEEIVAYMSSFDDVYCIKKRGAINWTYKYKSKTVMIVRGSGTEFKVSFKTYPDAAEKLNNVYHALEDSNFPSGPYWFMFNDLKNLSAPVAKWLIKESYLISTLQETKAELLRNEKSLLDLGIDSTEIKAQIDSGVHVITYDKFAVVAHKIDKTKIGLTTLLDKQIPGIFTEDYVKEVFYIVNGRDDLAISLLFAKNASEQLINALCMEIENFCTTAIRKQDIVSTVRAPRPKDQQPVKMVKKSGGAKRR